MKKNIKPGTYHGKIVEINKKVLQDREVIEFVMSVNGIPFPISTFSAIKKGKKL